MEGGQRNRREAPKIFYVAPPANFAGGANFHMAYMERKYSLVDDTVYLLHFFTLHITAVIQTV